MTKEEEKNVETKPEVKPEDKAPETKPDNKKVTIDIDGVSLEVDVDTGKKIVEKRQAAKKEVATLKEQIARVEADAKSASEKNKLLELMKSQDVEAVKTQVASEYIEKIRAYEGKIFNGEVKATLATLGIVDAALDDATKLAMSDVKVELKDGNVTIADKPAKDFLSEWVKSKPHLVASKQVIAKSPLQGRGTTIQTKKTVDMEKALSKLI